MSKIQRILCPVDFSDVSRHAVEHAVAIARWYEASITGLHVYSPAIVPLPAVGALDTGGMAVVPDIEERQRHDETASFFRKIGVDNLTVNVRVERGSPANTIVACAEDLRSDLIVLGTHGHGGFDHLILGSVTEKVLRKAGCPVLTVPPRVQMTSSLPFRHLLCPVDFSPSSRAAVSLALSLAEEGDAKLTFLHVLEWPPDNDLMSTGPFTMIASREERERDAKIALEMLLPKNLQTRCRPTARLAHGKPYRAILGVAAEEGVDVIVTGVQGRHPLDVMLFGSTTNQVVRRATCPVLTLRH